MKSRKFVGVAALERGGMNNSSPEMLNGWSSILWVPALMVSQFAIGCGFAANGTDPGTAVVPERVVAECDETDRRSFASSDRNLDLDEVLGARREVEEVVRGPRIRLTGIAARIKREIVRGDDENGFHVGMPAEFEWPPDVLGTRVVVVGCISRRWFASQIPSSSPSMKKNNIIALPSGYVYRLESVSWQQEVPGSGTELDSDEAN